MENKTSAQPSGKNDPEISNRFLKLPDIPAHKALNASASTRFQVRTARVVIARSVHKMFLVWMTEIEKLQNAFKQFDRSLFR